VLGEKLRPISGADNNLIDNFGSCGVSTMRPMGTCNPAHTSFELSCNYCLCRRSNVVGCTHGWISRGDNRHAMGPVRLVKFGIPDSDLERALFDLLEQHRLRPRPKWCQQIEMIMEGGPPLIHDNKEPTNDGSGDGLGV